jgi:hypothetical protein
MDKSYKNLLQEHFQQNKLALPVYTAKKVGDRWQASVILMNNQTFTDTANSKKEAELLAAKKACNNIVNKAQIIQVSVLQKANLSDIDFSGYDIVLLIDGENFDLDINKVTNNMLVLFFVSKNTTKKLVFQLQNSYSNCFVFISESVGRDAADHLLTFYAGKLSIVHHNKKYFVLTKDHYGEFLEKFMDNCKFVCSMEEIK